MEKAQASNMLSCSVVGSPETVRRGVEKIAEHTAADELIVATAVHEHQADYARMKSWPKCL
jgi:alkanesulfonate monooxygenase SsuD/methylene tetrahydromethanopterin reductase-like flavin-dependent oxidoreductase (luciferase family)